MKLEQLTLGDHQIRQAKEPIHLRRALGQPAIARPLVSRNAFGDVKWILNLCSSIGREPFELRAQLPWLRVGQRTALTGGQNKVPLHRAALILFKLLNT